MLSMAIASTATGASSATNVLSPDAPRPAAVAGIFYPGTAREMDAMLDTMLPGRRKPSAGPARWCRTRAGSTRASWPPRCSAASRFPSRVIVFSPKHNAAAPIGPSRPIGVGNCPAAIRRVRPGVGRAAGRRDRRPRAGRRGASAGARDRGPIADPRPLARRDPSRRHRHARRRLGPVAAIRRATGRRVWPACPSGRCWSSRPT